MNQGVLPQNGFVVWLTGLPSAGKSTIARNLEKELLARGFKVEVLDGDEIRQRLTKGLGYSKKDRDENIRRIGYVAKLLARNGIVAICAAISPYREERDKLRDEIERFIEVYVECPLEICVRRDVKGLYKKALEGEIVNFTGISDPYEPPVKPEVVVHTAVDSPEESMHHILRALEALKYVEANSIPSKSHRYFYP